MEFSKKLIVCQWTVTLLLIGLVAPGRFTLCQAWASLRPFNIARWAMSRVPTIFPGSSCKPGTLTSVNVEGGNA